MWMVFIKRYRQQANTLGLEKKKKNPGRQMAIFVTQNKQWFHLSSLAIGLSYL